MTDIKLLFYMATNTLRRLSRREKCIFFAHLLGNMFQKTASIKPLFLAVSGHAAQYLIENMSSYWIGNYKSKTVLRLKIGFKNRLLQPTKPH